MPSALTAKLHRLQDRDNVSPVSLVWSSAFVSIAEDDLGLIAQVA